MCLWRVMQLGRFGWVQTIRRVATPHNYGAMRSREAAHRKVHSLCHERDAIGCDQPIRLLEEFRRGCIGILVTEMRDVRRENSSSRRIRGGLAMHIPFIQEEKSTFRSELVCTMNAANRVEASCNAKSVVC